MVIDSLRLAKLTVLYFLVEPYLSLLLFNITGHSFFSAGFHASKDVLLFALLLVTLLHFLNKPNYPKDLVTQYLILFLLAIILLINCFYSEASLSSKILNIRRIMIPLLIFFVFSSFIYKEYDVQRFKKFYINITYAICFFGIVEFLLPLSFWDNVLRIPEYWNASDNIDITSIRQVGRGYTSDLIFITGNKFRRMLSFFLEPTTLGTYLSIAYAYFLFANDIKNRNRLLWLIFLSGVLCFSKLFLISVFLTTVLKRLPFKISQLYIITFLFFLGVGYFLFDKPKAHGALSHVIGLYSGFEIALQNPLGLGLGMAGNRPDEVLPGIINGKYGGESGIGNIWAQVGFLGSMILVFIYYVHKRIKQRYKVTGNEDYYALSVVLFVYFINLLLSASSLSLKGNFMLFVFLGIYFSRKKHLKKTQMM